MWSAIPALGHGMVSHPMPFLIQGTCSPFLFENTSGYLHVPPLRGELPP